MCEPSFCIESGLAWQHTVSCEELGCSCSVWLWSWNVLISLKCSSSFFGTEQTNIMWVDQWLQVAGVHNIRAMWTINSTQWPRTLSHLLIYLTWLSSKHDGNIFVENSVTDKNSHFHTVFLHEYARAKSATWTSNSLSLPVVQQSGTVLFLHVVTGVETWRLWHCFGDTSGRGSIWSEIQWGAMWPGSHWSPAGLRTCWCLYLRLLHFIPNLENSGHGGLHPACLVNARLGLKVASGLQFQPFIRALRDAGAAAEGLFKSSTKPVQETYSFILVVWFGRT